MSEVDDCIRRFQAAKNRVEYLESDLDQKRMQVERNKRKVEVLIKTRYVLGEVARLTQEKFKEKVEGLITMAIQAVFDRDFSFSLEFERKRNKFECRPIVLEGKDEYTPEEDMGGSIVDVIGFAFRIVLWSLEKPRTRNVMVLDEPGKWTGKLIIKFAQMIREISHKLIIQIILVTHDQQLIDIADRAWLVESLPHKGSHVKEVRSHCGSSSDG